MTFDKKLWDEAQAFGEKVGYTRAVREAAVRPSASEDEKLLWRLQLAENLVDWIIQALDERGGRVDGHCAIYAREQVALRTREVY